MYEVLLHVYKKKISNEVERIDNFRALVRKLSFPPTEVDSFYIRPHYLRIILFIFQTSDLLSVISNTKKYEISSIWTWISCSNDVMNYVDCVIKRDVYWQKMNSCFKNIRGI